jgi:hypothetical protein
VAPVSVGRVVVPGSHWLHVIDEMAWTAVEKVPGAQLEHFGAVPSLYLPATHAVQAMLHATHAFSPAVWQVEFLLVEFALVEFTLVEIVLVEGVLMEIVLVEFALVELALVEFASVEFG